jgi:hypothetical protein
VRQRALGSARRTCTSTIAVAGLSHCGPKHHRGKKHRAHTSKHVSSRRMYMCMDQDAPAEAASHTECASRHAGLHAYVRPSHVRGKEELEDGV